MAERTLSRARARDEAAFREPIDPYRRELQHRDQSLPERAAGRSVSKSKAGGHVVVALTLAVVPATTARGARKPETAPS